MIAGYFYQVARSGEYYSELDYVLSAFLELKNLVINFSSEEMQTLVTQQQSSCVIL